MKASKKRMTWIKFIPLFLALALVIALLKLEGDRQVRQYESRKQWIEEKFQRIKNGLTEDEVMVILGKPESKAWINVDDQLGTEIAHQHKKLFKYSYHFLLVKLSRSKEGGVWAVALVYFDEKDRKVVLFKSSSSGLIVN